MQQHHTTAQQQHDMTAQQQLDITALQHHSTALQQHHTTVQHQQDITELQQHDITASQQHSTALPQHHSTAQQHHVITEQHQQLGITASQHHSTAQQQHHTTVQQHHDNTALHWAPPHRDPDFLEPDSKMEQEEATPYLFEIGLAQLTSTKFTATTQTEPAEGTLRPESLSDSTQAALAFELVQGTLLPETDHGQRTSSSGPSATAALPAGEGITGSEQMSGSEAACENVSLAEPESTGSRSKAASCGSESAAYWPESAAAHGSEAEAETETEQPDSKQMSEGQRQRAESSQTPLDTEM